jgi:hypothetical protein
LSARFRHTFMPHIFSIFSLICFHMEKLIIWANNIYNNFLYKLLTDQLFKMKLRKLLLLLFTTSHQTSPVSKGSKNIFKYFSFYNKITTKAHGKYWRIIEHTVQLVETWRSSRERSASCCGGRPGPRVRRGSPSWSRGWRHCRRRASRLWRSRAGPAGARLALWSA